MIPEKLNNILSSKWMWVLPISLVVFFILYTNKTQEEHFKSKFKEHINLEFNSLIIDKYYDKENHNYETIIMTKSKDTSSFKFIFDKSGAFDYINEGDSIIKPIGDSTIIIKRANRIKIFTLDYK